jgi:enoyl-CoA hydratase/carnithine racemase
MCKDVLTDIREGVLTVRLQRPAKKNALTVDMYLALTAVLDQAAVSDAIRVVVVAGNDDAFTAGNDLEDFLANPPQDMDAPVLRFLAALVSFPLPLVAAVNGVAIGIGTTMLLHCELVYAGTAARFQLPFVNLGLVPEAASSLLLPRLAGYQRAAELLLLGEPFDAARALEIGLVNALCSPDAVEDTAQEAARALARKPRGALRASKALLKSDTGRTMSRINEEAAEFVARLGSAEFREAVQAFRDKRPPDFERL